jgi:hypothetical protein
MAGEAEKLEKAWLIFKATDLDRRKRVGLDISGRHRNVLKQPRSSR